MDVIGRIKRELPDFKFKFESQHEMEFRQEYVGHSIAVTRAGYLLCIFLYATFGIVDLYLYSFTILEQSDQRAPDYFGI